MRSDESRRTINDRMLRTARPQLEGLEDRLLLYSTTGGDWAQPQRMTFSYVPDGTNIGGLSSALYSTLNSSNPAWQTTFKQAAAIWEQVANVNLVQVTDNGVALDSGSYQQGDPNNGDIRISAVPLGSGTLASTFAPPPINGGPDAGDISFNSTSNWSPSTGYDLLTVAIHEFGHALGMGHSAIASADMYAYYNGLKSSLTTDDIAGIHSVDNARQPDAWTVAFNNTSKANAADISSLIGDSAQLSVSSLDINTSASVGWFKVTVPSSTTGSMTVTMQSTNLSELSPRVQVYNAAGTSLGYGTAPGAYGATVSFTLSGVTSGTVYYIKTGAAGAGVTGAGGYGLQVNFGSATQPPITPPNTQVANQPDQGGGSLGDSIPIPSPSPSPRNYPVASRNELIAVGALLGYGDSLSLTTKQIRRDLHPQGPVTGDGLFSHTTVNHAHPSPIHRLGLHNHRHK